MKRQLGLWAAALSLAGCTVYPPPDAQHLYLCDQSDANGCPAGFVCATEGGQSVCMVADGGHLPPDAGADAGPAVPYADAGSAVLQGVALGGPVTQIVPVDAASSVAVGTSVWWSDGGPWVEILQPVVAAAQAAGFTGVQPLNLSVAGDTWFLTAVVNAIDLGGRAQLLAVFGSPDRGGSWTVAYLSVSPLQSTPALASSLSADGSQPTLWMEANLLAEVQLGAVTPDGGDFLPTEMADSYQCVALAGAGDSVWSLLPQGTSAPAVGRVALLSTGALSFDAGASFDDPVHPSSPYPASPAQLDAGCASSVSPLVHAWGPLDGGLFDWLFYPAVLIIPDSGPHPFVYAGFPDLQPFGFSDINIVELESDSPLAMAVDLGPLDGGQSLWLTQDDWVWQWPIPVPGSPFPQSTPPDEQLRDGLTLRALGPLGGQMLGATANGVVDVTMVPDAGGGATRDVGAGLNGSPLDAFASTFSAAGGSLFAMGATSFVQPVIYQLLGDGGFAQLGHTSPGCTQIYPVDDHAYLVECDDGRLFYSQGGVGDPVLVPGVGTGPLVVLPRGNDLFDVYAAVDGGVSALAFMLPAQVAPVTPLSGLTAPLWGSPIGGTAPLAYAQAAEGLGIMMGGASFTLASTNLVGPRTEAVDPTDGARFAVTVPPPDPGQALNQSLVQLCLYDGSAAVDCEALCLAQGAIADLAFDASGDLWVLGHPTAATMDLGDSLESAVYEIGAGQLALAGPSQQELACPRVALTFPDTQGIPEGLMAFGLAPGGGAYLRGTNHLLYLAR